MTELQLLITLLIALIVLCAIAGYLLHKATMRLREGTAILDDTDIRIAQAEEMLEKAIEFRNEAMKHMNHAAELFRKTLNTRNELSDELRTLQHEREQTLNPEEDEDGGAEHTI